MYLDISVHQGGVAVLYSHNNQTYQQWTSHARFEQWLRLMNKEAAKLKKLRAKKAADDRKARR